MFNKLFKKRLKDRFNNVITEAAYIQTVCPVL